jgi:hypothetical protein
MFLPMTELHCLQVPFFQRNFAQILLEYDADKKTDSVRDCRTFVEQSSPHLALYRRAPCVSPGGNVRKLFFLRQ